MILRFFLSFFAMSRAIPPESFFEDVPCSSLLIQDEQKQIFCKKDQRNEAHQSDVIKNNQRR